MLTLQLELENYKEKMERQGSEAMEEVQKLTKELS